MKSQETIAIGWIDPGVMDGLFALSLLEVYRSRRQIKQLLRVEGSGLLSRMRNEVVAGFLDGECDWLLMVDSDESFTAEDFDKLVATAHAKERPFVAGLYFGTWGGGGDIYPQPIPLIFRRSEVGTQYAPIYDYPANKVIDVHCAGTGCLLVHRSVFEKIREKNSTQHTGDRWCWFMDMPVNGQWFGEDMFFSRAVESCGFPMVAHTGVILGHRKRYWLTEQHFERYRFLLKAQQEANNDAA